MKRIGQLFFILILTLLGSNIALAQVPSANDEATKKEEVKNLVSSGEYTFEATKLLTKRKGDVSLASEYDLNIGKDTVVAYLPKSRHEQPVLDSLRKDAGIYFTCTNFNYSAQPGKNGGWHITIVPRPKVNDNTKSIRSVSMAINTMGYTTLSVSTTTGNFSYYGYIKPANAGFPRNQGTTIQMK